MFRSRGGVSDFTTIEGRSQTSVFFRNPLDQKEAIGVVFRSMDPLRRFLEPRRVRVTLIPGSTLLRAEPHEQRRVLYLYTPVTYGDVGHLMSRIFEIKNDRTRAVHAGLALLDQWAHESPDVLPGLPPETEVKKLVTRSFSGERGIHGHLSSFLADSEKDNLSPNGSLFFNWLQQQGIRHRLTCAQLDAMVKGRLAMESFFHEMKATHELHDRELEQELIDSA